jgi:hypothetical protein
MFYIITTLSSALNTNNYNQGNLNNYNTSYITTLLSALNTNYYNQGK